MYLFTKKSDPFFEVREKISLKLVKTDYSKRSLSEYKKFKKKEIENKPLININLERELKNLLIAITFAAVKKGYKLTAEITGKGCYLLNLEKLEFEICEKIAEVLRKKNSAFIKIVICKNSVLLFENGELSFRQQKIIPSLVGDYKSVTDFVLDRLSPVNLAFIK